MYVPSTVVLSNGGVLLGESLCSRQLLLKQQCWPATITAFCFTVLPCLIRGVCLTPPLPLLPYPMLQCGASQIRRVASLNDHPTFVAVSQAHLHCMCLSSNILPTHLFNHLSCDLCRLWQTWCTPGSVRPGSARGTSCFAVHSVSTQLAKE